MEKPNFEKKDLLLSVQEMSKFTELNYLFKEKFEALDLKVPNTAESFLGKIGDFRDLLVERYGYAEVIKRKLFQLISFSSRLSDRQCPYLDFDEKGEDGEIRHPIEDFIRQL